MSSIVALTGEWYQEEVARARAMRPEDKLLEGPRLFDRACRVMADGIATMPTIERDSAVESGRPLERHRGHPKHHRGARD